MIWTLIYLLVLHYFADFWVQTEWQATNKWINRVALQNHVGTYTVTLALLTCPIFVNLSFWYWVLFWGINGGTHWLIDWRTSKMSHTQFSDKKNIRKGFQVVGADQCLHLIILVLTWYYLIR